MAAFKLLPDIFVPTFDLTVGSGGPLSDRILKSIMDISVTEHTGPPSRFSFRLNDPKLVFVNRVDGRFTEGTRVEISLGFVGQTRRMIVGEISALTADFPNSGPATVTVEGFDLLHRLTRGTVYRVFGGPNPSDGIPDSDIVTRLAQDAGINAVVKETSARTATRVQNNKSNLHFLEELAAANGYTLRMDGDTLHFTDEVATFDTIPLEWGKTLLSFTPRLSTAGQVNAVEVRGWDQQQKAAISFRATRSGDAGGLLAPTGQQQVTQGAGGDSVRVIEDRAISTVQEAQQRAEATLRDLTQSLVSGNGASAGPPDLRVGSVLELSGIGRFSGQYTVEEVTHSVSGSGYQTSFQVRARA